MTPRPGVVGECPVLCPVFEKMAGKVDLNLWNAVGFARVLQKRAFLPPSALLMALFKPLRIPIFNPPFLNNGKQNGKSLWGSDELTLAEV
jgi:hypothetical protein